MKPVRTEVIQLPKSFHSTALSFPAAVKDAIARMDRLDIASDALAKAQALGDYARRIKATNEEVNAIQYGKLLLAAKVGELTPPEKGGRGKKPAHGMRAFSREALTRYRKLAKHQAEGKIDDYWQGVVDAEHEIEMSIAGFLNYVGSGGVIATRHGGGVIERYTPAEHIERVREVLGTIDLDPASSEVAQRTVKATMYYDREEDGLAQQWQGRVFLNPPFKMPLVAQFVNKLCDALRSSCVPEAILLTNNNTDTDWWQEACGLAAAVCFTDGRISFYSEAGEWSAPTNGQTFMYFGTHSDRFVQVFEGVGGVLGMIHSTERFLPMVRAADPGA